MIEMMVRKRCLGLLYILHLSTVATFMAPCEGRSPTRQFKYPSAKHLKALKHLDGYYSSSDPYYNMGSPNSLPPYEDVMGPSSSPLDNPPYCVYPPFTPLPPSTTLTPPIVVPVLNPPPPPTYYTTPPTPPIFVPGPPSNVPSPPEYVPSPPEYVPSPPEYEQTPPSYVPSPPSYIPGQPPPSYNPSPPEYVPSPPEFVPGPIIFQPPVVYPPPSVPPPPHYATTPALWCVAKPTVPDPIIQEAMNYACGSGADCDSIQPNGACFQPDTLISHASYAFNSYWQRTKVAGGTCDFGGTAMLITKDPSYDGCRFNVY